APEPDLGEHFVHPRVDTGEPREPMPERVAVSGAPEDGAAQVLVHREVVEEIRHLEAARKALAVDLVGAEVRHVLAFEADGARGEREAPGNQVVERALAGAVGADDRVALARRHRKRDAVDDAGGAEALADVEQFERRRHAGLSSAQRPLMKRAAKCSATNPARSRTIEPTQIPGRAASSSRPASAIFVPWVESESRYTDSTTPIRPQSAVAHAAAPAAYGAARRPSLPARITPIWARRSEATPPGA